MCVNRGRLLRLPSPLWARKKSQDEERGHGEVEELRGVAAVIGDLECGWGSLASRNKRGSASEKTKAGIELVPTTTRFTLPPGPDVCS